MRVLSMGVMCWMAMMQASFADEFVERFKRVDVKDWSIADYQFTHPHFDTDWSKGQVAIKAGLELSLTPQSGKENRFKGASVRRHSKTSYGRYEAVIQPARGAGVVTGFFTYTGPYYGDRHDEIDIEFLGKNTRQIHLATFVDGKLWNKFIDLGFDASDRPRRYAFEWFPDRIVWSVEGRVIYVKQSSEGSIPQKPGMLFANIWAADPSIKSWSGVGDKNLEARAKFQEIRFQTQEPSRAVILTQ